MSTDLLRVGVIVDVDYRLVDSEARLLLARIEAAVLEISEDYPAMEFVVKRTVQ